MEHRIVYFILLFCCIAHNVFSNHTPTAYKEYKAVYDQLNNIKPDPLKTAFVENLVLERDAATFTLRKGTLLFLSPINGKTAGALFIGSGNFRCIPSTEIERKQLARFYEAETLSFDFNQLFLLFTDSTFEELSRQVKFAPVSEPVGAEKAIDDSKEFIQDNDNDQFAYDIFRPFIYNEHNGMFYAQIKNGSKSFFFEIDPYDDEEVSLSRNQSSRAIIGSQWREILCQFYKKPNGDKTYATPDGMNTNIKIDNYVMDVHFDSDLEIKTSCKIKFRLMMSNSRWLHFNLYYKLEIDSIVWANGNKAEFVQMEDDASFWIFSPDPFNYDEPVEAAIYYHGEIIKKFENWYDVASSSGWYPQADNYKLRATYDITYTYPEKYKFASAGENLSTEQKENFIVSRWVLRNPYRNASFCIGNFKEHEIKVEGIPVVKVLISEAHDASFRVLLAQEGILSGGNMEKQVGGDIANSFHFFQHVYGNTEFSQFSVAEVPALHGLAFPGLVHLSWTTFQNTDRDGGDEAFRAHEVAHQWWGISVDFKTYHDQWLSEAFSEYSGLWYMQTALQNNKIFFNKLKKYKERILSNRKYLFDTGQLAGPIWLGYRNESRETGGDYSTIVYMKGAWVLHMLRNMVLDLKTMKEDVFEGLMRDFYTTYKGKLATTDDFRRITEKHLGIEMQWFFKQWVYNTDIPKYEILYKREDLPNGKYKVHCTVKQTNVPDDFQAYVPFFIDFGNNQFARVRYLIKGPITEFDFPILPLKPKEIKFNDLESVLCEIEDEDWD